MKFREPDRSTRARIASGLFAVALIVIAGAAYQIARNAQAAVLDSQAGSISAVALDPNAPGFRAFTEPTPSALVLHTAVTSEGRAELRGLSVLAAADGNRGGTLLTIPASFVPFESSPSLDETFATEGFDMVVEQVRDSLGIGFGEVVVLDAASWTNLMTADLPLELALRESLVQEGEAGVDDVLLEAGSRSYSLDEVALIAGHRNPDEPTLTVARRQQEIWRSWISRTASSIERPELFQVGEGFVELIGALASGETSYRTIPAESIAGDTAGATSYVADHDAIADLIAAVVPFPLSPTPGSRADVMLLDGVGGAFDQNAVLHSIVRAGGQVAILGNADVALDATLVQVHNEDATAVGQAIAEELGTGLPVLVPLEEATVSITVTVGADRLGEP
ncbi:MAG: hypothetical protein ACR2P0_11865 [Acidimicrobiales bacterium]